MEIRIVIFLAFVSVTLITNTLVILFAYRALAGMTTKLTATMAELGTSSETRELIESLQAASKHAASITESAKLKMASFDPALGRLQESYRRNLAAADSKLEKAAENINTTAQNVRDMIAKPVFTAASFSAGLIKVLRDG
jgi:phosphoenolpyruvate carboxylase